MLYSALGHSCDLSPAKATEKIVRSCAEQLDGRKAQAGFLFTSILDIDYNPVLRAIHAAFPGIELIGCTTDGETSSMDAFSYDSMTLMVLSSDSLSFSSGIGLGVSSSPDKAVAEANAQAVRGLGVPPVLSIVLADGLSVLDVHLDLHLKHHLGQGHPVFGAKAGDRFRLQRTFQFQGGQVVTDGISIMHVGGPLAWSSAVLSGLSPIGDRFKARCTGPNVLSHVGDMTALDFYTHYIGDSMDVITQFPLAVFPKGTDSHFLRPPCFIDDASGSVIFNGTFPESFEVQLTEMGRDSLLEAAHRANETAVREFPGSGPQAGLVFSCCSRRAHLGTRTSDETRYLLEMDSKRFQHNGFYSYGEIAPLESGGPVRIHNETYVVLMLGEG